MDRYLNWFYSAKIQRRMFYLDMACALYFAYFWVAHGPRFIEMNLPWWSYAWFVAVTVHSIWSAQSYWSRNYK